MSRWYSDGTNLLVNLDKVVFIQQDPHEDDQYEIGFDGGNSVFVQTEQAKAIIREL